jgi:hypothetical protein
MSSSVFCIEQRQLETRQARKWLVCGLIGSLAAHGLIALALGRGQERSPVTEEPIELIIVVDWESRWKKIYCCSIAENELVRTT